MKTCRKCGQSKPLEEFYKASNTPDGLRYWCKQCNIAAARQRATDNPEAHREAMRRYGQTDKYKATRKARRDGPAGERIKEQKRESWYRNHDSNLEKLHERQADPEFRAKQRERYERWRKNDPRGTQRLALKNLYGITLEQWDRMLIRQGGLCAICEKPTPDLHVDHCHDSGNVRALLCHKCNRGLGLFEDDADLLRAAARYLVKHKRRISADVA